MSVGTAGQEKMCVTVCREKRHSGQRERKWPDLYGTCRPPGASSGPNGVEKGRLAENKGEDPIPLLLPHSRAGALHSQASRGPSSHKWVYPAPDGGPNSDQNRPPPASAKPVGCLFDAVAILTKM